jgi:hypothetical protein
MGPAKPEPAIKAGVRQGEGATMPLSTILRVGFDADITRHRGDLKRPAAPQRRKSPDPAGETEAEADGFVVVSEGAPSNAGLSILAQALAAYSEN